MNDTRSHSLTLSSIVPALIKAQQAMGAAIKTDPAQLGNRSYTYAPLHEVIAAVKPALNANGIAFTQLISPSPEGSVCVTTMLLHESGEWLRSDMTLLLPDNAARTLGSVVTYACRYALRAITGLPIVGEDDDGAAGGEPEQDLGVLADHPVERDYLAAKARELFGDVAESVLQSLALRRYRLPNGDWRQIPRAKLAQAVAALEKKAADASAERPAP